MIVRAESGATEENAAAFVHGEAPPRPDESSPAKSWEQSIVQDETPAFSMLPLVVRQVRLADVPDLRHLDPVYELNQPHSRLKSFSAMRVGMLAALPGVRARRPAFSARSGDRVVGFATFQPRDPDERWVLMALGTAVGVYESNPVIEALLEHGVRSAGLRGVKRLYARAPRNAPIQSAFRRQAWTPYATEMVYAADQPRPLQRPDVTLRAQEPSDTWAIHQLYSAAVPKPIHDAEALTSHHWDVKAAKSQSATGEASGWLLEDGHALVGYARIMASARAVIVELVYHPERTDRLPELVDSALEIVRLRSGRRVFCAVRGYQAELATSLEERAFHLELEQELLIKYTTATVRLPIVEAVPFQLEVGEKIPQRVPTFLQGSSGDGAAS
jgi:hypothetical protein